MGNQSAAKRMKIDREVDSVYFFFEGMLANYACFGSINPHILEHSVFIVPHTHKSLI